MPAAARMFDAGGRNPLREGLDLPEVSLVAAIDADKEGFCAVVVPDPDGRSGGPERERPGDHSTPTRSPRACSRPSTRLNAGGAKQLVLQRGARHHAHP